MKVPGIVIAVVLAACVDTSTVACRDGSSCPSGKLCVRVSEVLTVCTAPYDGECLNVTDGELCGAAGRCYDETCVQIACGDHIVDPTEVCDGGNAVGGDGCSADCRSDEMCGTGAIDLATEACDDGNSFVHDGCASDCWLETPRWTELKTGTPGREDASMAFDPVRGRVVMFGGSLTDTGIFEWNGFGWTERPTQFTPKERFGQATAYDVERQNLVLFGGQGRGPSYGDTWVLERAGWRLVSTSTPDLVARSNHAMAYDPVRKRVVMFGGLYRAGLVPMRLDDTWEWDGTTWSQIETAERPMGRDGHSLAYDPARGTIILFGGLGEDLQYRDDTWEWNGTTWTQLTTAVRPSHRAGAAMTAYRGGLLLHGGKALTSAEDDTWRWVGGQWSRVADAGQARHRAALATDTLRDRVVLFGGYDENENASADVFEWDGAKWSRSSIVKPAAMLDAAVAFDSRRGRAVVVEDGTTTLELVEESSWSSVTPSPFSRRVRQRLAYDQARDEVVMFGGDVYTSATETFPTAQTWVLRPTTAGREWEERTPVMAPSARSVVGLTYDVSRSRAVLFGGYHEISGTAYRDTWEWDGLTWHDVSPATGPSPRYASALAYDPIRRVTVLFGGEFEFAPLGDTWEWNGTEWKEIIPVGVMPIARGHATLTWNPARRRLTLIGGASESVLGQLDDAWEWDGTTWTVVSTELRPPGVFNHLTVPSPNGSGLITFGGERGLLGATPSIWRLRWEGSALDEVCPGRIDRDGDQLAGCADPDCWASCSPTCGPGITCAATAPRCGDGVADPTETCQLCPADLPACPACGDLLCEASETIATCPGDCAP